MFELSIDAARALLRIVLKGQWTEADMARFEAALPAALESLGRLPGPALCLVEARAYPLQPPAIADRHARLFGAVVAGAADHVATVLPGALAGAQARRMLASRHQRFFEDRDQALAWLVAMRSGAVRAAA